MFTVIVVAVFVVVVVAVVANDDVTIVTCVCLLFTCSGCRAGLPPFPPGAFCSWHARALVRLLGGGAAFQDGGAVFDSWVSLAVHANTCYKQRLGYFLYNIEQNGFGFGGLAKKSNMK